VDDPRTQSALLGWIIGLAITVSILLKRDKDVRQRLFCFFAGNVTLYYVFDFLHAWQGEPWFERIGLAFAVILPQTGLRFFRAFAVGARTVSRLTRLATVIGLVLLAAVLVPSWARPAVGPAVLAYVVGFLLVAVFDLNVRARSAATRVDAARMRYLVIGALVALSMQILDRLGQVMRVDMPPLGLAMTMIYLFTISQIIVRNRVLDLYEMLGRFAVLTAMGISLAAIYTALVFWVGRGFTINAFLASLVILILFDPLRELVERKIADFFFRERLVLEEDVASLRHRLAHIISIDIMTEVLLSGLEASRRVTHAALYLIDPHGRGFDLRGSAGPDQPQPRVEAATVRLRLAPFASRRAIAATVLTQRRAQLHGEGDQEQLKSLDETLALFDSLHADVVLLIEGEEQLLGFLTVRDERLKDAFSPEEVALLAGLAGQVAITVENSRLYQQTKERDRLAALGQMAAGLAHEIRNPLGAIKAAAQYIEEVSAPGASPVAGADGQQEFLGVIVEEVDRLNRVLSNFLAYARPSSGQVQLLDVNEILRRTLQVFETQSGGRVDLTVDTAAELPRVKADGERLHQVFLNLLLNAAQAMEGEDKPRLDVSTRLRSLRVMREGAVGAAEPSRFVEVRFADSGPGIPPETLQNIFIPFFTTKAKGSGLGLALCQRLVRDAGGEIEVRSQVGQGAIFTVVLPAAVD
jgi:two-component system, NtrC family, sensor histidine kinase HydH